MLPNCSNNQQTEIVQTARVFYCVEYDDLTKYVVSTERYDPIHYWMESVLRISTGSLGHQIAALILRDVRPEDSPFLIRSRVIGGPACLWMPLTISFFWFIIKYKGRTLVLDMMIKWLHWIFYIT